MSELSLEMKQRLGIARAIISRPRLIILDEPINGLDVIGCARKHITLEEYFINNIKQ